jgi:hypothetical protein
LLAETGINDIDDTINCQGGFSNVGADNNFSSRRSIRRKSRRRRIKDFLLLIRRQRAVERDYNQLAVFFRSKFIGFQFDLSASVFNFLQKKVSF